MCSHHGCRHGGLHATGTAHRHDTVGARARAAAAQQLHGRRSRRGDARHARRTICRRTVGRGLRRRRPGRGRPDDGVRRRRGRNGSTRDDSRRRQCGITRDSPRCTTRQDHDGSQGQGGQHPHHSSSSHSHVVAAAIAIQPERDPHGAAPGGDPCSPHGSARTQMESRAGHRIFTVCQAFAFGPGNGVLGPVDGRARRDRPDPVSRARRTSVARRGLDADRPARAAASGAAAGSPALLASCRADEPCPCKPVPVRALLGCASESLPG